MCVEHDTLNFLHVSHGGDDHQLVSADREGVIPMPINTSDSDYGFLSNYVLKCVHLYIKLGIQIRMLHWLLFYVLILEEILWYTYNKLTQLYAKMTSKFHVCAFKTLI